MRRTYGVLALSPVIERCFTILLALCAWLLLSISGIAIAQTVPITPSGLNTQVDLSALPPPGKVQYDITGGTRPEGGANLFHSFGEFGVPADNIANFLNETGLPTFNILARVTGTNGRNPALSSIYGTIQTTGFGDANLFLMNPAGFLFGPNATVNVGGMVAFTSADYLQLADNVRFNAILNGVSDVLLTASPVAAFGFLGSNPGAITVQGSKFTVTDGQSISFIGGDISIEAGTPEGGTAQPAQLSAPNGKIQLASAASPGEFDAVTLQALPNVDGASFASFGSATLAPGSSIDVSGTNTVSIRGGQFVLSVNDAVLNTAESVGPLETISLSLGSSIMTSNSGTDPGANVKFIALNVQMDGGSIKSTTMGNGPGGDISMNGQAVGLTSGAQILSITEGRGAAGEVNIQATTAITISGTDATGQVPGYLNEIGFVATGIFSDSPGGGTSGAVSITSPHISVSEGGRIYSATSSDANAAAIALTTGTLEVNTGGGILTTSGIDFQTFELRGNGKAGNINITASDSVSVAGIDSFGIASAIQSLPLGVGAGGTIRITTPSVSLNEQGTVNTFSFAEGPAGDISLETGSLAIAGGGGITTSGSELASSGSIFISAQNSVLVTGTAPDSTPSRIVNENAGSGGSGFLTIDAKDLLVSNGARIRSDTFLSPQASSDPKLVIHATDSITLTGDQSDIRVRNFLSDVGGMQLTTRTFTMTDHSTVSTLTFAEGNSGPLTLTAEHLSLSGGSQITSVSLGGSGHAGIIQIQGPQSPADLVIVDGASTGLFTTTSSTGAGGDISLNSYSVMLQNGGKLSAETSGTEATATGGSITVNATDQVVMTDGASITSSSTGPANAGNIQIDAGNQFAMTNSAVTTEADFASGGAIKITTNPSGTVELINSTISASVLDGTGGGGSVNIDPQFVILQNSQILAQAVQGPGGNISITTNLLLPDANSVISASSQFGVNGTVTIQSPNAPGSGQVQPLGKSPLLPTSLLNQHCAALAGGEFSSFTVAGRDSLPTEPGSWLASPLVAFGAGEGLGVRGEGLEGETALLSLRQIAPVGFLTQAFAVDWSAGCQS